MTPANHADENGDTVVRTRTRVPRAPQAHRTERMGDSTPNTNTPITSIPGTTVTLEPVEPNPYNTQAAKRFIFNETGNIMLASTEFGSDTLPDEVRGVFAEVSVFFAAMTKAISSSIDPISNQPYSLYNYNAIQNVVDGSGLFVHVTEEDIQHTTSSYGATFSKELIEGLLGLAAGAGALSFAQAMIASIGSAGLKIGGNSDSSDNRVANIVFICEYLLGMPIVSAMVVSCDAKENSQVFRVGPCFSEQTQQISLTMHKDTYMFVTPKFIRNYSSDLESVATDLEYLEFVDYLQDLVQGKPIITAVESLDGKIAPAQLVLNQTYAMTGAFLDNGGLVDSTGRSRVKVAWVGADNAIGDPVVNAEVQANVVSFSVGTAVTAAAAVGVFFLDDTGANPVLAVATPMTYTAG